MFQVLKNALCIDVLYSAQKQQEKAREAKDKDMLQMQATWTLHW
jgi:hypothetical protein